jgi:hypothetical protein
MTDMPVQYCTGTVVLLWQGYQADNVAHEVTKNDQQVNQDIIFVAQHLLRCEALQNLRKDIKKPKIG